MSSIWKGRTGLDIPVDKPHEAIAALLADDLSAVNALIRERMASRHAPRIPEVTAHLVEAGGKRIRPMLTLAAARLCGYDGPWHVHLAATVEFIHTATLLHDDVVDLSELRRGRATAFTSRTAVFVKQLPMQSPTRLPTGSIPPRQERVAAVVYRYGCVLSPEPGRPRR